MSTPKPPEKKKVPAKGNQDKSKGKTPQKKKDAFTEIRERLELDDEMREMFEEDKVTHQHGSAEPEGD